MSTQHLPYSTSENDGMDTKDIMLKEDTYPTNGPCRHWKEIEIINQMSPEYLAFQLTAFDILWQK